MNTDEVIISTPVTHKFLVFAITVGVVIVSAMFISEDLGLNMASKPFLIAYSLLSICGIVYLYFLFAIPIPTLAFDSRGLSKRPTDLKVPWDHVEIIERVAIPGMNQCDAIAIRFVENSEFKSTKLRSSLDWDRNEKYDLVVSQQHCDMPLDDLEQQLRSFQKIARSGTDAT